MKWLVAFYLFFIAFSVRAQSDLDSLYAIWQDTTIKPDERAAAYVQYIVKGYLHTNPDSAAILARALLGFSDKYDKPRATATAYAFLGYTSAIKSDYPAAISHYDSALKTYKRLDDKRGISDCLVNIGIIYFEQGDYPKSLHYNEMAIAFNNESGDLSGSINNMTTVGNIYFAQGDLTRALEYYQKSLDAAVELEEERSQAIALNNIGQVYFDQADYTKALDYYERSLRLKEKIGYNRGLGSSLLNIGKLYFEQKEYELALDYFKRELEVSEKIGDQRAIGGGLSSIGRTYLAQNNYSSAIKYCKQALILAEDIEVLELQKEACQCLYDASKFTGQDRNALDYLEQIRIIEDSLRANETAKKLQQIEFQKEVFADSVARAEEARLIEESHQETIRKKNQTRNWSFAGGAFALLLAIGFYTRWRYVRRSRDEIAREKDRSENLLLNILPAEVAEELKEKGKAKARDFDMVSILFTDFVAFTETAETLTASELVEEINTCFEAFDRILEKYNIEKIKTIGDAYMAAGGLPAPTEDSTRNTVLAALEMQEFISRRKAERDSQGKTAFEMRVGVHTGPVVAGIVGVKKFQYDIWGDAVNTASRMESNSEAGKVNISKATYDIICNDPDFEFVSRGNMAVKGKGQVEMWFVMKAQ